MNWLNEHEYYLLNKLKYKDSVVYSILRPMLLGSTCREKLLKLGRVPDVNIVTSSRRFRTQKKKHKLFIS